MNLPPPDKMVQKLVQKKLFQKMVQQMVQKIVQRSRGPMVQSIFYVLSFRDITG